MTNTSLKTYLTCKASFFENENQGKKSKEFIAGYIKCIEDILYDIKQQELDELI